MIQPLSILNVADNSGAKTVKCIGLVTPARKLGATIGDCIIVSVRTRSAWGTKTPIKKGQIFKALIIRTRKAPSNRHNLTGHSLSFSSNEVVLIKNDQQNSLVGSRIFGPIPRELAYRCPFFRQVLSQAQRIL